MEYCFDKLFISTHSLTRRLTHPHSIKLSTIFISTHSLTRRLTMPSESACQFLFISTHSLTRRLTRFTGHSLFLSCYFNSQPHKEADDDAKKILYIYDISTHSLTRRLTVCIVFCYFAVVISTHSLTRRLTIIMYHISC